MKARRIGAMALAALAATCQLARAEPRSGILEIWDNLEPEITNPVVPTRTSEILKWLDQALPKGEGRDICNTNSSLVVACINRMEHGVMTARISRLMRLSDPPPGTRNAAVFDKYGVPLPQTLCRVTAYIGQPDYFWGHERVTKMVGIACAPDYMEAQVMNNDPRIQANLLQAYFAGH